MASAKGPSAAGCRLLEAETLLQARHTDEALRAYDAAEALGANPEACAGGRWLAHMLRGDMEAAWAESDAIRARSTVDPHRFWDGRRPQGRVMVRCLHGYGDTIQMLRYLPALMELAIQVILELPPRLSAFARCLSLAGDKRLRIITWDEKDAAESAAWDMQIEVTELPYLFRTQRCDLPIAVNYVQLTGTKVVRVAKEMGASACIRVGVGWTAGEWNRERAIAPELLRDLLSTPAEFWSLVQRSQLQIVEDAEIRGRLRDAEELGEGILPMAAVIRNLDLVISTDTMAAHMAGAMGVAVWVLLPYAADWRWMADAETSSWYPSMRLFRQTSAGDWDGVLQRVSSALHTLVAG